MDKKHLKKKLTCLAKETSCLPEMVSLSAAATDCAMLLGRSYPSSSLPPPATTTAALPLPLLTLPPLPPPLTFANLLR